MTPQLEVSVKLTPQEFREHLPPRLKGVFDALVEGIVKYSATSEEEAQGLVAKEMFAALKKMKEDPQ